MKKLYIILISIVFINFMILGVVFFNRQSENPEELTIGAYMNESALVNLPALDTSEIDNLFQIYTLNEWFNDRVEDMVYLDPTIITHDELRLVTVLHVGFDGQVHEGEIIVNYQIAEETVDIFRDLYDIGFPIESVRLISEFDGDDYTSMMANNSHGFNFRKIAGTDIWSEHAFGLAIDINPMVNPFVRLSDNLVKPAAAMDYIDRDQELVGIIRKDDPVYRIFTSRGWIWGGDWEPWGLLDFHHFERPLD